MNKKTVGIVLKSMVMLMFGAVFLWSCANAMQPTGGPRDSLPPVVIGATPSFGTTDFKDTRITISFDEYVQVTNQQSEFFVSPPLKKKPTIIVKGRGIQIDILDTLKENTTYALNFGNSVKDNNEGNPLGSFRYVFSTGKEIDSMYMSAYTVSAEKGDTVSNTLLFFFPAEVDSIPDYDSTMFNLTPSVLARGESNGIVLAQNLKPIDYRVYAVKDNNTNFAYDPGVDDVAFLDSVLNPISMPEFSVWYDTTRHIVMANPQVNFRLFRDENFKRQRLNNSVRPSQHQLRMEFSASYPQIKEFTLEGIDSDKIVTDYVTRDRDTILYWLDVPSESLPDTIKGRMIYMKHDSLNVLVPDTAKLEFFWRYVESDAERRAREEEEKKRERAERNGEVYEAPKKPNPFKVDIQRGTLNPEQHLSMTFGMPVSEIDTTRLLLLRNDEEGKMFRVRYGLEQDSVDVKKWLITAPWNEGDSYNVVALQGAFTDVARQQNDSTNMKLTVLDREDFGTLVLNITPKSEDSRYVIYLLDSRNKVLQTRTNVSGGQEIFRFITPGDVVIKVLEDLNGNGVWDTGNMVQRRQPERNEIYYSPDGEEYIAMKANWEVELDIDMNRLFAPVTTESMRERMSMFERKRQQRLAEAREARATQEQQQQQGHSHVHTHDGGMGGFGMNGLSGQNGGGMNPFNR
ncbi:MAG: Ig-like domain-containing protein [Tidjanibacter sp.]|nr:Ig-like domain-containing protein [Tidjanibacter sp.]